MALFKIKGKSSKDLIEKQALYMALTLAQYLKRYKEEYPEDDTSREILSKSFLAGYGACMISNDMKEYMEITKCAIELINNPEKLELYE